MEDFGALIVILFWFGLVWFVKTIIRTARKTQTKKSAGTAVPKAENPIPAPKTETPASASAADKFSAAIPFRTESAPFAPRTESYVGSLGVIANGPGSMGGESGEGIDPCHEEQSREMDLLEAESALAEDGANVLPEFTAAGIAKAVVMSEILNRKRA